MKKIIFYIFSVIIAVFALALTAFPIVFHDEINSLNSLVQKQPGVYTMKYDGDYGLDAFLMTGAKSDVELESFVTKKLLKGLPLKLNMTEAGCTAFVSRNEKGEILFARNFDFEYAPFLQVFTKPKSGYASVSTVNLSFIGYDKTNLPTSGISANNFLTLASPFLPFDGMNEKGLCIALLSVPKSEPPFDSDKVTLNTTTAIRLVLDKAATVEQAVSLLSDFNIYFSGGINCHYLISDASGKSVIVEYFDGELQIVKCDKDYQIASNFIACNGLNIGEGFTEFERYNAVENFLKEKNNVVSVKDCENLLNAIGIVEDGTDKLQWSVVYNSTRLNGKIWTHRNSEYAWNFTLD